jgi:hypothetical protein
MIVKRQIVYYALITQKDSEDIAVLFTRITQNLSTKQARRLRNE